MADSYSAEFETIVAILRIFAPGKTFADDFCWVCTIKRIDHETCELCGVMRRPNGRELQTLTECLWDQGFRRFRWLRIKNGKHVWKEFTRWPANGTTSVISAGLQKSDSAA